MTTSYELSLKLKELGAVQEGEYYWVELWDGTMFCLHKSKNQSNAVRRIACRAFTLGELVRELPFDTSLTVLIDKTFMIGIGAAKKAFTTPEEAAGELFAQLIKQKA